MLRRLIAISLMAVACLSVFVPLATALETDPVPACCRRGGVHQCLMSMAGMGPADDGSSRVRIVPDPCPYRSQRATPASTAQPQPAMAVALLAPRAVWVERPNSLVLGRCRSSSTPPRGPPQLLFPTNS